MIFNDSINTKKLLCFGDSNTWGYIPETGERYDKSVRWTGILQERLGGEAEVLEEGLCGRTTVFEDKSRPGRKGIAALEKLFASGRDIDAVVIMLGTNDCKAYLNKTPFSIAKGMEKCIDVILEHVSAEKVILVSPINR